MADTTNKLIIITAPSGAGKTSITKYLMKKFPQLAFSISVATRKPRTNEINGVDYYFMSKEDFDIKEKRKEFVEWEMVYEGNYYGTLKSELKRIWKLNKIPVMDIDVIGAIHVQQKYPINSLSLFIQAPSVKELKKRLVKRGTETAETLAVRIKKASYELEYKHHFNKLITNDNLQRACRETERIVADFINQS